jgi:Flp pilus assembly pilin Flp
MTNLRSPEGRAGTLAAGKFGTPGLSTAAAGTGETRRRPSPHGETPLAGAKKGERMTKLHMLLSNILRDENAQDFVEYALLAGLVAVTAGATIPDFSLSISTIFSKMSSVTILAGS